MCIYLKMKSPKRKFDQCKPFYTDKKPEESKPEEEKKFGFDTVKYRAKMKKELEQELTEEIEKEIKKGLTKFISCKLVYRQLHYICIDNIQIKILVSFMYIGYFT